MKPPVTYYGGKISMAPWIVSFFPPHRVYVEPFAGSAAVLFAKAPSVHEVLNDVDGDVVNFFRLLRDRPEELERACRLTPYARDEYQAARADAPAADDLEQARRWWVCSSQAFGKVAKRGTGWAVSIERGSNNARSARNLIDRFAAAARRLSTVTIEHADALEVIERFDASDGVIYADPPYLGATRTSFAGGRRPNGDYTHEFAGDDDHRALAKALQAARATVILSGYRSELYEELYAGWEPISVSRLLRSSNGRGGRRPVFEVLWCNRPGVLGGRLFPELADG